MKRRQVCGGLAALALMAGSLRMTDAPVSTAVGGLVLVLLVTVLVLIRPKGSC